MNAAKQSDVEAELRAQRHGKSTPKPEARSTPAGHIGAYEFAKRLGLAWTNFVSARAQGLLPEHDAIASDGSPLWSEATVARAVGAWSSTVR